MVFIFVGVNQIHGISCIAEKYTSILIVRLTQSNFNRIKEIWMSPASLVLSAYKVIDKNIPSMSYQEALGRERCI